MLISQFTFFRFLFASGLLIITMLAIFTAQDGDVITYLKLYQIDISSINYGLLSSGHQGIREALFLVFMNIFKFNPYLKHVLLCSFLIYLLLYALSTKKISNTSLFVSYIYLLVFIGPDSIINFPRQSIATCFLIMLMTNRGFINIFYIYFFHVYSFFIALFLKYTKLAILIILLFASSQIEIISVLVENFTNSLSLISLFQLLFIITLLSFFINISNLSKPLIKLYLSLIAINTILIFAGLNEPQERIFKILHILNFYILYNHELRFKFAWQK